MARDHQRTLASGGGRGVEKVSNDEEFLLFLFYTFTFRFGRHHLGNQWGWWWEGGDQKGGWHGGRGGSLEVIL